MNERDTFFQFTFKNLEGHFKKVLNQGYTVIPCRDYIGLKSSSKKILVNRVDIDVSPRKAKIIAEIFNELGIKATFFVRLHAEEYNPFSFENYNCLKYIRDSEHEIGYHSEIIDESVIWNEDAEFCLNRDIEVLSRMLNIQIQGIASHGGMTGLNNLDFWKEKNPNDFGLLYEAYDRQPAFDLFHNSLYISDSEWTQWKCYSHGIHQPEDNRSLGEHSTEGHPLIYSLIHPETFYNKHFYE